ncbi:MAG: hypothetical protein LBF15_03745 [Candidatus Peribacteria bacterium]|jgi:hypothetical protein|nr:hypothetical protein [Candidatus Peribacteria bacterium]
MTAVFCILTIILGIIAFVHIEEGEAFGAVFLAVLVFIFGSISWNRIEKYDFYSGIERREPYRTFSKSQNLEDEMALELAKCALIEQFTRCANVKDKDAFLMSLDRKYLESMLSTLPQKEEEKKVE